jgi:hypothetical protein
MTVAIGMTGPGMEAELLGVWRTDPGDEASLNDYGDVSLAFAADGSLTHTTHLQHKAQISHLTYRVEGTTLITDQPSSPTAYRTAFSFTADGRLAIIPTLGGPPSFYRRVSY